MILPGRNLMATVERLRTALAAWLGVDRAVSPPDAREADAQPGTPSHPSSRRPPVVAGSIGEWAP